MMEGLGQVGASGLTPALRAPGGRANAGGDFADTLRQSIDEVTRLQRDASQAVQDLATGRTDDVTAVMTAMEKSDVAFKTLLAIRAKLMDAYEEIRNIQI